MGFIYLFININALWSLPFKHWFRIDIIRSQICFGYHADRHFTVLKLHSEIPLGNNNPQRNEMSILFWQQSTTNNNRNQCDHVCHLRSFPMKTSQFNVFICKTANERSFTLTILFWVQIFDYAQFLYYLEYPARERCAHSSSSCNLYLCTMYVCVCEKSKCVHVKYVRCKCKFVWYTVR